MVAIVLIVLIVYRKPIYGSICSTWKGIGMDLRKVCCKHHVVNTCYGQEGLIGKVKDTGCSVVWKASEFKKNCKKR